MFPERLKEGIAAVVENAIDKDLAIKELKGWGYEYEGIHPEVTNKPAELGGIALDFRLMDLQIRRDGNGVPLPVSQQPLDEINIQGFVPQVINIQSVNLLDVLGLNSEQGQKTLAKM